MTEAGRITAAIDGDVSGLANALNQARSQATAAAAGIESDVGKSMQGGFGGIQEGLTKSLTSGDFSSAGAGIGNQVVSGLSSSLGPIGGVAGEIATTLGPSGIIALGAVAGGAAIAAALISGISSAVAAAGQFETAMSGAKKVISVDDSSADAYFKQLGSDLQELSTQAPVSANDLAALAAVGGSLGVASDQIAGFAQSAAQMSVAFELPAEEAATAAAKILNAFQQPINTENMQSLGNVINQIGDSMAATEADVLDFTNRASFLNTTMGLSVTQVATLGGVLISAGLTAETAAGGLKSAMNSLTSETSKTGGMDNWAELMGVSVDELKAKVASDLPNALIETANKIAAIEDPVQRFQTAVALAGSEGAPALLKLAGATDTYNSALAQTISQWDKGQNGEAGGMAKTFEQNSSTYEASGQMLSNAMTYASVSMGNVFLPAATAATSGLTSLVVGAVQAGSAIGSLVSNSQAASAIGSAFSSIGSIASSAFGNLSSIVTPVWNAIGGGTAVMAGLQAAFDAATSPITLVFTGISTLAGGLADLVSAAQPVASVIGSDMASAITTASSAIQTGSAYAQAFGEAISDLITNSAAAQAIGGIFDSISTSISGAVDFVSDLGSKIVSGLTTAIPQAASGFSSAIGSLVGQAGDAAGGYFEDAIKDSPLGGIFGFAESISARASEIMKTGEDAGAAVGAGIKNSEELNEGLAKAADFDSPENIEAAKKAGINVGGTAGQAAGEELSKEWVAAFEQAQADRDIAKILARSVTLSSKDTDEALRSFEYLGEQFELTIKQHSGSAAGDYFEYSLYGGDTRLDSGQAMGYADPIALFEAATGLPAPEEGSAAYYRLLGDEVAAKKAELQEELAKQTTTFDYSGISDTFSQQFADRLANEGAIIGKSGSDAAVDAYTSMLDSMRDPMLADLGSVLDEITTLSTDRPLAASEYQLFGATFKDKIASQVTDAELFTKEKLADISESATSALSDGIIDSTETEDLLGLKPELEFMQQYFPEQFEVMGGKAALKLIAALEAGDYSGAKKIIKENFAVDSYLDFAENLKNEIEEAGIEIGEAFVSGMIPDADQIDTRLDAIRRLKLYDPDEYERQGAEAAEEYLISLQSALDAYEAAKIAYIAEPSENTLSDFEKTFDQLQGLADDMPVTLKLKADDEEFIKVLTAYYQNGGNVDWNALGVSNPQRYLEYAKKQLSSEVSTYAEQGRTVPEGETLNLFTALQSWFHQNYATLDATNRTSSALLDQALSKGGLYWDQLYAHMGLLSTDVSDSGKSVKQDVATAGTGFVQQVGSSTAPVFRATDYFEVKTDAFGNKIATIGSNAQSGGQIGGAAMASGGQTGGQAIEDACATGAGYLVDASSGFKYNSLSDLPISSGATSSGATVNVYPLTTAQGSSQSAKALVEGPWADSSDLAQWGGVPLGWASSMDQATASTAGATQSTDSLCASTNAVQSGARYAANSLNDLGTSLYSVPSQLADAFYPLADVSYNVQKSAYDTSEALSHTAESMDNWCEAASDFAYWQETTAGLFYDSYIGPTSSYTGSGSSSRSSSSSSYRLLSQSGTGFTYSIGGQTYTYTLPSVFQSFADEGYISSPTLAVVGDRPGGEYVVGAQRFESFASKAMGASITINSPITIPAGMDAATFDAILEKRNRELEKKISAAAAGI